MRFRLRDLLIATFVGSGMMNIVFGQSESPSLTTESSVTRDVYAVPNSLSLSRHDGGEIDPNIETWVLIHGNGSHPRRMQNLAATVSSQDAASQVLLLDWSNAARMTFSACAQAENHIPAVADWAYERLVQLGIPRSRVRLIGHSLGAYVADRLAARFGRVASIIALEPAIDVPSNFPFGGSTEFDPTRPGAIDFGDHSVRSWSFRAVGSPFGLDSTACTAHENFLVSGTDHSGVVDCLARLISIAESDPTWQELHLSRLLSASELREWEYDSLLVTTPKENQSLPIVMASQKPARGLFEAHIVLNEFGEPTELRYVRRHTHDLARLLRISTP